ncbi:MAG: CHAD domain-containing protein [Chthoniobacterales bacterium]
MSYKLSATEPLGESLQQIVCREIDCAIAATLDEPTADCSPVHETRRRVKKIRAALRLLRPQIHDHAFRRADRQLRNVGRTISEVRDAEVRLETLKQLRAQANARRGRTFSETEELLAFELDSFLAAFAGWQAEARAKLARVQKRITDWDVSAVTADQVCAAVKKSYRQGRDASHDAQRKPNAKTIHHLRKRVKTFGYQLRILRPLSPPLFHDMTADLKILAQQLGHAHDLCFLAERLRSIRTQRAPRRGQRTLETVIEEREDQLQASALALAERFFSPKPRDFAGGLSHYFADWANTRRPAQFKPLRAAA